MENNESSYGSFPASFEPPVEWSDLLALSMNSYIDPILSVALKELDLTLL
jgi:hypothetical protein